MTILIITHLLPYPLTDGGRVSQFAFLDYARKHCSIHLVVFTYTEDEKAALDHLRQLWPEVSFHVIQPLSSVQPKSEKWLVRKSKALGKAILHKANQWGERFLFEEKKSVKPFDRQLMALASFVQPREESVIRQLVQIFNMVSPDLVQLEFVYSLDLVFCLPRYIPKFFVHHELRFVRLQTEMATAERDLGAYGGYIQSLCEDTELKLLNRFDGIITVSEMDKKILQERLPEKTIIDAPFPILDREFRSSAESSPAFDRLLFLGGEMHTPNKDAIEWYVQSMAASVYASSRLVLHVIGNWTEETKRKYTGNPAIVFAGYIENVARYGRNGIMLVPLRIGSGIRQKILYSAAWRIPVISTTLGSEGIPDADSICFSADEPEAFVERIKNCLHNPDLVLQKLDSAQQKVRNFYSQQVAGNVRLQFYMAQLSSAKERIKNATV